MNQAGVIAGVSVAHDRASVDEIEAAGVGSQREVVARLLDQPGVTEAFALCTCNRAEAYVATDDAALARRALDDFAPEVPDGSVRRMDHEESIRHLMRVASGLESLVLGEDQIIGQVKDAIEDARNEGALGNRLEDALTKAVHVGERARTETAINEGTVSLGSAAIDLATEQADLTAETALVVGAGEMGTLVARSLDDTPVEQIFVANRTVPHAEHVACEVETDAEAIPLDDAAAVLDRTALVVTATNAPEYVLTAEDFSDATVDLCIDLAQPRDVAPEATASVDLRDIDDLEAVTDAARDRRASEVGAVESLIDEEFDRLLEQFKRDRADEAVSSMYEAAERTKQRELTEAIEKLEAQGGLTDEQRETVGALADALVGQLLAAPTKSLREAAAEEDWTTIHTAMRLFDPEFDGIDADPGGRPAGMPDDLSEADPEDIPADAPVDSDGRPDRE
ncbi:MAG: glutamyl-tRNA reductase [Halobaculum sp.]